MNYFCGAVLGFAFALLINVDTGVAQSTGKVSTSDSVRLSITVTGDDRAPISGLPQNAFTISDDTGVREILSFSNEDVPISIAILFDLSGSVVGVEGKDKNKVKVIAEALSNFILNSNPSNEYFIIGFANTTYVLADGARDTDTVLSALQKFASVVPHGNTALYDACRFGIDKVKRGVHSRQVIILISDGMDNGSRTTLNDIRSMVKKESIVVYALNLYAGQTPSTMPGFKSGVPIALKDLTSISGGLTYSPGKVANIRTSLESIASELRHQYSIHIKPTMDASRSKWHSLKVKVTPPSDHPRHAEKLTGRTREGYFSILKKEILPLFESAR